MTDPVFQTKKPSVATKGNSRSTRLRCKKHHFVPVVMIQAICCSVKGPSKTPAQVPGRWVYSHIDRAIAQQYLHHQLSYHLSRQSRPGYNTE